MAENEVAQALKAKLVEEGYEVVYSENSGRIFGYDILKKDFGNGNSLQAIIRNHMVSIDVSDQTMKVVHHASFEGINDHTEFIEPVLSYFVTLNAIYSKK